MAVRVLLEVFKFLPLEIVYPSVSLVSSNWKRAAYSDEVLLNFIALEDTYPDDSLPPYERLKECRLARSPRYLLHIANSKVLIWDIISTGAPVKEVQLKEFLNSSRYALDSKETAVITGGSGGLRSCFRLHLVTGEVARLPDLLGDRKWHGSAALDHKVYVGGGDLVTCYLKSAEMFDGVNWTRIADMTTERYNVTLGVYRKRIYAFGGSDRVRYLDSIEFYDGEQWTLAPMRLPTARNYVSAIEYQKKLIIVSGFETPSSSKFTQMWDEEEQSWRLLCESTAEYSLSNALAIRKKVVYIFDNPPERIQFSLNF